MVDQWMVIGDEGQGLVDQIGVPLSQGYDEFKKLPFSFRVVTFSYTQLCAVIFHWVLARGMLLLYDSAGSQGRCISQEVGSKRGVKKAEDWC